jgi:hypothetical protein
MAWLEAQIHHQPCAVSHPAGAGTAIKRGTCFFRAAQIVASDLATRRIRKPACDAREFCTCRKDFFSVSVFEQGKLPRTSKDEKEPEHGFVWIRGGALLSESELRPGLLLSA